MFSLILQRQCEIKDSTKINKVTQNKGMKEGIGKEEKGKKDMERKYKIARGNERKRLKEEDEKEGK